MNNKYWETVIPVMGLQVQGQLKEFSHPGNWNNLKFFFPLVFTSQHFIPWEQSLEPQPKRSGEQQCLPAAGSSPSPHR